MNAKKPPELSPEAIARSNRKRVAAEEGARAMADVEKQAIEVRKNMARLREAREAKEAAEAPLAPDSSASARKERSRKPRGEPSSKAKS